MKKFITILATIAFAFTALFASAPANAAVAPTQSAPMVAQVKAAKVAKAAPKKSTASFSFRAYTKEQALQQCATIGSKSLKASCVKAANGTKWANKADSIKSVKAALKTNKVQKHVKKNMSTYKKNAAKYETTVNFERDADVCTVIFPDNTKKLEKKNAKKLSDCINLTISSHYMYE